MELSSESLNLPLAPHLVRSPMLPPDAQQLARLVALRRLQGEAALSLDAYERWGSGSRFDQQDDYETLSAQIPETMRAILELTTELHSTNRVALDAFIDGQLELLDAFVLTQPEGSVERSVAREERAAREEVRRGERAFVRQNTHFVQQDAALFEQIFGFPPNEPGA